MSEARAHFTAVLARAERGEVVEVTRNGRAVAAVVPLSLVARSRVRRDDGGFVEALRKWRASVDPADLEGPDPFAGIRSRSPGRRVRL